MKTIKIEKIGTTSLKRLGQILLWILVAFILFRGVLSIVGMSSADILQKEIHQYQEITERRGSLQIGSAAFAEEFATEYYSFSGSNTIDNEYDTRIKKYLAKGLVSQKPENGIKTEVLSAKAYQIAYNNEGKMDIDVRMKVKYSPLDGSAGIIEELCVRIPLTSRNGKFAVDALPIYIPTQATADINKAPDYPGIEVAQNEKAEIKDTLGGFLKTYYEGNDKEISYFVTKDSLIKSGFAGRIKYNNKIISLSAYYVSVNAEYLVDTTYSVIDNGQITTQRLFITMVKDSDNSKYYVKDIATRAIEKMEDISDEESN